MFKSMLSKYNMFHVYCIKIVGKGIHHVKNYFHFISDNAWQNVFAMANLKVLVLEANELGPGGKSRKNHNSFRTDSKFN